MKKRDFILIIIILILAMSIWIINFLSSEEDAAYLLISVDNQQYGVYDLSSDQCISINDKNECQIVDGRVAMVFADCPDKVCVHSASISRNGQTIICMPNRVVLEIISDEYNQIDTMTE